MKQAMCSTVVNEIAVFCGRHGVKDPAIAAVLPAVFEAAGRKTGRSERSMISLATYGNQELATYLIEVATTVARGV